MFRPYRKLAKDSEKRERDSCMSWRCMKLASRSAMESARSAREGSRARSGEDRLFVGCCEEEGE